MKIKIGKIIGAIAIAPFVLIALGVAFCEANKAYWDHQVKLMCEKNGGVTVYEKVEIDKSDYPSLKITSSGYPIFPLENKAIATDPIFIRFRSDYIRNGFISIVKSVTYFVRNSDKKILGKQVLYTRGGGDFPAGFHPSHYSCKEWKKYHVYFNSIISVKGI